MRTAVLGFLAGVLILHLLAELPSVSMLAAIVAAAIALGVGTAWIADRWRAVPIAIAFALAGFAWAGLYGAWRIADRLDPAWEGRDVTVVGVVASLPQPFEQGVRFDFDVETVIDAPTRKIPKRVALSWFNGYAAGESPIVPAVRAGERWRFTLRLKRPHGNANPHGFDFEAWLTERGIAATGYVRPKGAQEKLDDFVPQPGYVVERVREQLRDSFVRALPEARYAGVLIALAIGDQRAIVSQDWDVYTRTGVGHLMSISGLHVTMISGLIAALVSLLWRRSERLTLALPARKAAAVGAVLGAAGYCLIAGFQVPAQRTLYMITVVAVALWLGRLHSSSRVLAAALGVVLLLDPFAVTSPGFWLSFGAVAAMLYAAAGGLGPQRWYAGALRTQWAVTVGLAPVLALLFHQISVISPIANAIAIPVVSFLVTPLALIAAVLPQEGTAWVLPIAHRIVEWLMVVLDVLSRLPAAVWQQHAPALWTIPLALAGAGWLLAPRGVPTRWAGVFLMGPMFAVSPPPLPAGAYSVATLDVGQGLAVVVRTASHTLVYDSGPRYSTEADAGNRVLVPYLRGEGVTYVDRLVITHADNDHAGGAASVMKVFPTGMVLSSLDGAHSILAPADFRIPCTAGQRWRWDGVEFEMLHPSAESYARRVKINDRSCVLRVAGSGGSVLLTGDIEARAERELLARGGLQGGQLRADVLLVPHHGSRTSSTEPFIDAVGARYAIVTAGYRNRFGHPKANIMARYEDRGIEILRTDRDGALIFNIDTAGMREERWRVVGRRWWHRPGSDLDSTEGT